jgi:hypothetical protein
LTEDFSYVRFASLVRRGMKYGISRVLIVVLSLLGCSSGDDGNEMSKGAGGPDGDASAFTGTCDSSSTYLSHDFSETTVPATTSDGVAIGVTLTESFEFCDTIGASDVAQKVHDAIHLSTIDGVKAVTSRHAYSELDTTAGDLQPGADEAFAEELSTYFEAQPASDYQITAVTVEHFVMQQ